MKEMVIKVENNDLFTLEKGSCGTVYHVTDILTDAAMRSRLRELGLINGTEIVPLICGAGISSYRIRGAQIALRTETAAQIAVRESGEECDGG